MNNRCKISLQDNFFAPRQARGAAVTIPEALERCRETGRLDAFRLSWKKGAPNEPHVYWDSDVAKVLEGMAHMTRIADVPQIAARLEELVDLVISAQQSDGYLNTRFTAADPEHRWCNLFNDHELYCAGHLIESAVAHFTATGDRRFLNAVCRYADYIGTIFGPGEDQRHGYPGHEEIELALVKLARATGEKRYLELAKYFIDERGREPNFFLTGEDGRHTGAVASQLINRQAHVEVRQQHEAVGHAVRALYLYCGMADVAHDTSDAGLMRCCEELFANIADKKMYLTGGVGSTRWGEAFLGDYALPNGEAYAESCAAIALVLFARRMLDYTGEVKYADVMERALYNGAISGLSLSGDKFFYANPLEVTGDMAESAIVRKERQKWFSCSCCPTSYCRFLPQIGQFCYRLKPDELCVDIPAAAEIDNGCYAVKISGDYPWHGAVKITVVRGGDFTIRCRIPAYCRATGEVKFNHRSKIGEIRDGYWTLHRNFVPGDTVELNLPQQPELIYASSQVNADTLRAAVCCGPVVYAFETADNGVDSIGKLALDAVPGFSMTTDDGMLPGVQMIECDGYVITSHNDELYSNIPPELRPKRLRAVPFALWQNRALSEMRVFLPIVR